MSDGRHARGRDAENAVEDFLVERGFAILARNLRLGPLEIDVLAVKDGLAVLVEVRTRGSGSYLPALASITSKKRATILRAAERLWRTRLAKMRGIDRMRIDVAAVTLSDVDEARVEYIEGAITA